MLAAPAFAAGGYFSAVPDLPIPPGMSEDEDMYGGLFSDAQGRLVSASAHGPVAPETMRQFYTDALPALGWSLVPTPEAQDMQFVRGRERLVLHTERQTDGAYLRVRLIVRPASTGGD